MKFIENASFPSHFQFSLNFEQGLGVQKPEENAIAKRHPKQIPCCLEQLKLQNLNSSRTLCQMTLPDSKAIWVAGSWLWYLSAYKKKYLCSHFHRDHSLFGPANKSSFKGCTQLRTPSWAVTWQLGKVCTHFTLHFSLAHTYNKKTTKIKNRKPTKKLPALSDSVVNV